METLEKPQPLDSEIWKDVRAGLDSASAAMMRAFLRYYKRSYEEDLAIGSNDTKEQLIDRIHGYLNRRRLALGGIFRALVDFADFGAKTAYLYRLSSQAKAGLAKLSIPQRVDNMSDARIANNQKKPAISYSYLDARRLRVSFSELQKHVYIDPTTYEPVEEEVNRVVAMVVNRDTGLVSLQFDSEMGQNVTRGDKDYHQYYTDEIEALLGAELRPVDLRLKLAVLDEMVSEDNASENFIDLNLSSLVRMPTGRFRTKDGFVQLTGDDYRRMSAYSDVRKTLVAKIYGQYVWLKENDLPEDHKSREVGRGLLREVYTKIDAYPARIQFMADVLREEVEYVLRQIT